MEQALLIPDYEAEQIIKDLGIPPCPEILTKLLREMREDEPDYIKISNLISGDVSLAAAMLKTVNSSFFGLRKKAASVQQALTLLGLRNVKEIVTGLLLKNALPTGDSAAMEHFWDTSSGIAQAASMLAGPLAGLDREETYTFALFRDCGIPLMVKRYPDYDGFYDTAVVVDTSFTGAENAKYAMDHARVGAHLARSWDLPKEICDAIACHHDYEALNSNDVPVSVKKLIALTLAAENIHARCASGLACPEWAKGSEFAIAALGTSEKILEDQLDMIEGILGL